MPTTKITAEDVLRCDSPWRDYEIWDGIPMVREPSGGRAGYVGARVLVRCGTFVEGRNLGWFFPAEQGFLIARHPDRLLAPDGAFVSRDRLPTIPEQGFIEMAPDFLIEVRSPTDAWEAVVQKCAVWLAHGTQCAWAIDPLARKAAIFRPGLAPELVGTQGTLRADPGLAGFEIAMSDLFAGID